MNDVDPILLLMAGLFVLGAVIVWGLGIYVAVRAARARRRPAWPWVLLAILPGPVFLGTAHLAGGCRRSVVGWVTAEAAAIAVIVAVIFFPAEIAGALGAAGWAARIAEIRLLGHSPILDLVLLTGIVVAALGPLIVLALLGPRPWPAAEEDEDRPLIRAVKLKKSYDLGGRRLHVLRGVTLSVRRGEFVAILGASGSGKSTLLHLLGLLDQADSGSVIMEGADSAQLSGPQRDRIRCRDIGFVFQFYHLLPELNVVENVLLPSMTATGIGRWAAARGPARQRAIETLGSLGLGERLGHRPRQLSGGEQQRVAIGRGLVNRPKILLADEPTGNLDSKTGAEIIALLKKLNRETRQTIVIVTHDESLARNADRVLRLRDGRLQ